MIEELAEMAPGPGLATALAAIDRDVLNGHHLVLVMCARARQVAHEQAQLLADIWAVAHCPIGGPDAPPQRVTEISEFAADEIRFALGLTRRAADAQLTLAVELLGRLPRVHAALNSGTIDLPKARVTANATTALDDDTLARRVADQALVHAPELTTGQLRARMNRLLITADPATATRRHNDAHTRRLVELRAEDDGTATLTAFGLAPDRAVAAIARLNAAARARKTAGDPRTLDQLRADLLLDLLDPPQDGAPAPPAGSIELVVPLTTLMHLAEQPGDLTGYGPIIADLARQIAQRSPTAHWGYTITDPETGQLIHHGTTRRRPTTSIAAHVQARDRTCRAPGCRIPAHHADLDHTTDWAHGGPSTVDNLGVLCRHDHRLKHEGGWKLHQIHPGVFQWTSPLGHRYTTRPPNLHNGPSG